MMVEIVPTKAIHIRPLAMKWRNTAQIGVMHHGYNPRRALHDAVIKSHFCRTALVDGKPEAMWGLMGPMLSEHALVWLAMSDQVTRFPKLVFTEARRQLEAMGQCYAELATTVLPEDRAAIAFAVALGFHDRHDDETKSRKQRMAELLTDPRHRLVLGDKYVIALGWHGNA